MMVASLLAIGAFHAQAAADSPVCLKCHSEVRRDKFVHNPVADGECVSCHQPVAGKKHPDEKGSVTLIEQGAKLCYNCHDDKGVKKFVHGPAASGDCTACHDPHKSPNRMQLKSTGAALCLMCHEDKFKQKHTHPPVAAGDCTACHDTHQSDYRMQLKKPGAQLCFDCHDPEMVEGESVHPPVAAGDCIGCHQPHGSRFSKLLKREFPEEFYLPYNPDNFALCFECHSREMVEDRRTDTLTGFRNGDRNLHYLHVNRLDKGRSCKVCHEPHASSQAKLIKVKVSGFGKWEIPIKYTRTLTGGACMVGCHKPRAYDRVRPVIY